MTLAELMKKERHTRGLSLQKAADKLGITKPHLHDIEQGQSSNPTLRVIAKIMDVYDLRIEDILASTNKTVQ